MNAHAQPFAYQEDRRLVCPAALHRAVPGPAALARQPSGHGQASNTYAVSDAWAAARSSCHFLGPP
jgi:hypothetical protein